jgi:hypothetical protein
VKGVCHIFYFRYTCTRFKTQVQLPFQLVISASITHKYLLTSEFKPARGHKMWAMRQLPFIARLGVTLGRWDVAPIFGLLLTDLPYQFYDKIGESSHINRRYVRELYFSLNDINGLAKFSSPERTAIENHLLLLYTFHSF